MMSCRLPNSKNIPSVKSAKLLNFSEETALSKPIPVSDAVNCWNSMRPVLPNSAKNISKKSDEKEEKYGGIWDADDEDIDEDNNNTNNVDISQEKSQNINDKNSDIIFESTNSSYINEKEKYII